MIHRRIVVSSAPVTTIDVQGTSHHFFHSERLGKCRAILIAEDENIAPAPKPYATKPLSKGEQLEALMDCSDRLHRRFMSAYDALHATPYSESEAREAAFEKAKRIQKANRRLNRKIAWLLDESR